MAVPVFTTINASLNFLAGVLLLCGWLAIKRKNQDLHRRFMTAALICSAVFLVCYVSYHAMLHGVVTRYQGVGIKRLVYFTILLTHTPLAMIIVPFCLRAVWHARREDFVRHTRITRWLYPVWMYVSVTGVIIYVMLYILK